MTNDGEVTIPVSDYCRLKECERAILEDRTIVFAAGSGWGSYYIPKTAQTIQGIADQLRIANERADHYQELLRKAERKLQEKVRWYQFWK